MASVSRKKPVVIAIESLQRLELGALARAFMAESAAFKCLCVYLFFEYVRPQSIYESLDVLPFALLSILMTAGFWFMERNKAPAPKNAIDKLMVVFTVVVLLSAVFAYSPADSFKNITLPLSWAIVYVLISRIAVTETRFFLALLLWMLFSFKMSQHGFRSWAGRGFAFEKWGVMGAPGWFSNSGEFGIQMTIFLPISAMFYVAYYRGWGWIKRGIIGLMPMTAAASVLASSSRGALVGSVAGALWLMMGSRKRWKALTLLVLIFGIGLAFLPPEFAARFDTAGSDSTSLARLERWEAGMETFYSHPLLGIGYDSWIAYYSSHYTIMHKGSLLMHNMFIQAASELGLAGLIPLLALIVLCFVNMARVRRLADQVGRPDLALLSRGFDAATIGFIVSAAFVTVLFYPFLWIHLAFIVAFRTTVQRLPAVQALPVPSKRGARLAGARGARGAGARPRPTVS